MAPRGPDHEKHQVWRSTLETVVAGSLSLHIRRFEETAPVSLKWGTPKILKRPKSVLFQDSPTSMKLGNTTRLLDYPTTPYSFYGHLRRAKQNLDYAFLMWPASQWAIWCRLGLVDSQRLARNPLSLSFFSGRFDIDCDSFHANTIGTLKIYVGMVTLCSYSYKHVNYGIVSISTSVLVSIPSNI